MGNLTIQFEATGSWDRAKAFLAQLGIESAFLLNANPEQIQYALDNVTGIVVVRVYDPFNERRNLGDNFEKDIVFRHTPLEFVDWLNRQDLSRFKGNERVRFVLGWNEMYYAGSNYQRLQNEKMIAIADALIKAGYGVALFGLASDKTIQMEDAIAGVWDTTVEFLQDNSDWAHLDCHEYEVTKLASAHLKTYPVPYPRSIEDPISMARSNWGEIAYEGANIAINYHIGRIAWLLQRGKFPYARGEMGWDYKADGALGEYISDYQKRFPRPSGLNTLRPLFNHLANDKILNDTEFCEAAYAELEWFASFDPDCLSNAIFADNNGSDHSAFNIGLPQYARLYQLLGQQKVNTPMPTLYDATISSKSSSNIRVLPSATANILRVLTTSPIQVKIAKEGISADGYTWLELSINGERGYLAKTSNVIIEYAPIVPTEPLFEVALGYATIRMTAQQVDWLATIFEGMAFAIRNAPPVSNE